MPTDLVSLLLYVGLLLPGFAFSVARSRHRPLETRTAFHETASAVFVSVICDSILLTLVLVVAALIPGSEAEFHRVVRDPAGEFGANPLPTILGGLAFLAVASVLGFVLGTQRVHALAEKVSEKLPLGHVERAGSTWHTVFDKPTVGGAWSHILVGVELTSGVWIQGRLFSYDRSGTDVPDRGLVLAGDLMTRDSRESPFVPLPNWSLVVITDRNIASMTVAYVAAKAPQ